MDDLTLKKHRLRLDLMALEAELSRVIMLNAEPPLTPEDQAISQGLIAAHGVVATGTIIEQVSVGAPYLGPQRNRPSARGTEFG
jgi:hypothetical protein